MIRSQVDSDVLQQIRACVMAQIGDRCREYRFARTRGIPPADCNSITVSWMDRARSQFGDCETLGADCGEWNATLGLRVVLTRVCIGPDQAPEFNWDLEDAEAACFNNDLDVLEECIQCSDWSQLRADHSIELSYVGTTHDIETEGGGYSAYVELTVVAAECCSIEPVPVEP